MVVAGGAGGRSRLRALARLPTRRRRWESKHPSRTLAQCACRPPQAVAVPRMGRGRSPERQEPSDNASTPKETVTSPDLELPDAALDPPRPGREPGPPQRWDGPGPPSTTNQQKG